jgi:pimeloyl-ACP methyl ester carboxylesterase
MASLRRVAQGVQIVGGVVLGLGGFWIVYSRITSYRAAPLPAALPASRWSVPTSAGRVSYYANVSGNGRPLVLIHSVNAAASAFEMQPLFAHYEGRRPVYALELPGFGFSERAKRAYTPGLYAAAIGEFLRTVVEEPADVVALSLGSEFAARAALNEPGRFHSLALISPSGLGKDGGSTVTPTTEPAASSRTYRLLSFPLWGRGLFDLIATRGSIHYFLQRSFTGEVPQALEDYAYASSHQPGAEHAPLAFISGELFTRGATATLYSRLSLPVLVLYDQDAYVGFDALPGLMRRQANWRAVRIAPTRGLPHWEQLDATTAALDAFWQSLPAAV